MFYCVQALDYCYDFVCVCQRRGRIHFSVSVRELLGWGVGGGGQGGEGVLTDRWK